MKTEDVQVAMHQLANIAEYLAEVYETAAACDDDLPPNLLEKLDVLNQAVLEGIPFASRILKESLTKNVTVGVPKGRWMCSTCQKVVGPGGHRCPGPRPTC